MKKLYELIVLFFGVLLVLSFTHSTQAAEPSNVTIVGSLQNELGCPGDWQPDCAATHLTYDANDTVWQGTFAIPAGSWEYKAALNDSWAENYGSNATQNGPNISFPLAGATSVKFYYDNTTHWVTSNQNSVIAVAAGSFQSELGCPGDWQPDCLRSWLKDPDGDGIYKFSAILPAGSYETKVAINESWDENYGAGGVQNGPNIPFNVPSNGTNVLFSYDPNSHILIVNIACDPDLTPPITTCSPDITKESTTCTGEVVNYIASTSDSCGLSSFDCTPNSGSIFPVGKTTVTCTAVNLAGLSSSCSFNVTVSCNQCPTADPLSVSVDQDSSVNFQLLGSDLDNDPLQYSITQGPAHGTLTLQVNTGAASYTPTPGYIGPDSFKYKVNDGLCDSAEATVSITVADATPPNQPPECSKAYASPDCLWPPNNKMVPVNILGVYDPDGDPVTITITSVTSDEATATEKGAAGPKHAPDASGVGTSQAMIRAERSGLKDGRVYVINFMGEDGKGGMCNASVVVKVPHDQSSKSCPAVDSGQKYDATKIN